MKRKELIDQTRNIFVYVLFIIILTNCSKNNKKEPEFQKESIKSSVFSAMYKYRIYSEVDSLYLNFYSGIRNDTVFLIVRDSLPQGIPQNCAATYNKNGYSYYENFFPIINLRNENDTLENFNKCSIGPFYNMTSNAILSNSLRNDSIYIVVNQLTSCNVEIYSDYSIRYRICIFSKKNGIVDFKELIKGNEKDLAWPF